MWIAGLNFKLIRWNWHPSYIQRYKWRLALSVHRSTLAMLEHYKSQQHPSMLPSLKCPLYNIEVKILETNSVNPDEIQRGMPTRPFLTLPLSAELTRSSQQPWFVEMKERSWTARFVAHTSLCISLWLLTDMVGYRTATSWQSWELVKQNEGMFGLNKRSRNYYSEATQEHQRS